MPGKVCLQGLRNRHCPTTGARLRRSSYQALTWQVDQLGRDVDAATVLLDITPSQSGDLAPPQGAHGSDEDEGPQRWARHTVGQFKNLGDGKDRSLVRTFPISSSNTTGIAYQEPIIFDRCRQHRPQQPV